MSRYGGSVAITTTGAAWYVYLFGSLGHWDRTLALTTGVARLSDGADRVYKLRDMKFRELHPHHDWSEVRTLKVLL